MITNHYSWSLGPTPDKSLDRPQAAAVGLILEPSIPIHRPGDPLTTFPGKNCAHTSLSLVAPPSPLQRSGMIIVPDRLLTEVRPVPSLTLAPNRYVAMSLRHQLTSAPEKNFSAPPPARLGANAGSHVSSH